MTDTMFGNAKRADGFGHEIPFEGKTNDWITPKWIIDAFDFLEETGKRYFDLDPCASLTQPWGCASIQYTEKDNGLLKSWAGNVWLNPPYGPHTFQWVKRLTEHRNGVALIFARVETQLWQKYIFPTADGYLFPSRRIAFARPDGTIPKSSSGAPSALIAWGDENYRSLIELCDTGKIEGAFFGRAFYTGSER